MSLYVGGPSDEHRHRERDHSEKDGLDDDIMAAHISKILLGPKSQPTSADSKHSLASDVSTNNI